MEVNVSNDHNFHYHAIEKKHSLVIMEIYMSVKHDIFLWINYAHIFKYFY